MARYSGNNAMTWEDIMFDLDYDLDQRYEDRYAIDEDVYDDDWPEYEYDEDAYEDEIGWPYDEVDNEEPPF